MEVLVRQLARAHFRIHECRGHYVDIDPVRSPLGRKLFTEHAQPALASDICSVSPAAQRELRAHRTDMHMLPTRPLPDHVPGNGLGLEHRSEEHTSELQ